MKLNCDLGESYGNWTMGQDKSVMPYIDQANVACGFHAGDPVVLANTISLAKTHQVSIGAHPSYPDLNGFGRRSMSLSENELRQTLHYQIAAIAGMAQVQGVTIDYIKPHGALYNDMMKNAGLRQNIMQAVADFPLPVKLMLQATPKFETHKTEAQQCNVSLIFEAFADRCYTDKGLLVSRSETHAVHSEKKIVAQVEQIVQSGTITSEHGKTLRFPIDSLCVHGDHPESIQLIQLIRECIHGN